MQFIFIGFYLNRFEWAKCNFFSVRLLCRLRVDRAIVWTDSWLCNELAHYTYTHSLQPLFPSLTLTLTLTLFLAQFSSKHGKVQWLQHHLICLIAMLHHFGLIGKWPQNDFSAPNKFHPLFELKWVLFWANIVISLLCEESKMYETDVDGRRFHTFPAKHNSSRNCISNCIATTKSKLHFFPFQYPSYWNRANFIFYAVLDFEFLFCRSE